MGYFNKLKALPFLAICVFLHFSGSSTFAQENTPEHKSSLLRPIENKRFGFTLQISNDWIELPRPPGQPLALVLLKWHSAPYPTFNVLIQPSTLNTVGEDISRAELDVVNSYKSVGITDVTLIESARIVVANRPSLLFRLNYTNSGVKVVSTCIIVSGEEHHFILTFIDEAGHQNSNNVELEKLLNEIRLPVLTSGASEEAHPAPIAKGVLVLILSVASLGIIVWRVRKR